jgi:hypothetical protein
MMNVRPRTDRTPGVSSIILTAEFIHGLGVVGSLIDVVVIEVVVVDMGLPPISDGEPRVDPGPVS